MQSKSMSRRLTAQRDFQGVTQSLFEKHGEKAHDVLRDMIQNQTHTEMLGDEYVLENYGNFVKITKDGKTRDVPIFALREVVQALVLFG